LKIIFYDKFYISGVWDEPACNLERYLTHAVLVVGYKTLPDKREVWIIKNSWGKDWGDDGYFLLPKNAGNQCGVATMASFPML
jgi:cathepsin L